MQHWVDQEFTDCDFNGADLAGSVHDGSAFRNCRFRETSLVRADLRGARIDPTGWTTVAFAVAHGLDVR